MSHPKTLVVWGPSRTGKTAWARSLGHHSYMNSTWNQDAIDEGCKYIIFDDIPFDTFRTWKGFLGA